MSKLLRANFTRLIKSKSFWSCVAVMLLYSIGYCLIKYWDSSRHEFEHSTSLDTFFFMPYIVVGVLAAVFCSLFIGTEYSDGTIRNKLVVGLGRSTIYLANFVTCSAAGLLMDLAYLIGACALGIPLFGLLKTDFPTALLWLLAGMLLTVAHAAIFSLLSMLNRNKAVAAIVSVVIAFAAFFLCAYLDGRMSEPEFRESTSVTVNSDGQTTMQQGKPFRNPYYLNDSQRARFQFVMDFLPTGQAWQLTARNVPNPGEMMQYSVFIIVVTNIAGVLFFRRKDLK